MHTRRRLLALVTAAGVLAAPAVARATNSWTSFGHDAQLQYSVADGALTNAAIHRLAPAWTRVLDGSIIASPLAATVHGRLLVFASTEAGSMYALNARTGAVVWQRSFGDVETVCGTYGFSSTGAIDLAASRIYAANSDGLVHALDLATGADIADWPQRVVRRTLYGYVYGGLQLVGRSLYVPTASYCDALDPNGVPAEGRLVRFNVDSGQRTQSFDPVPGLGNLGGIWGWGGVSVDAAGYLYTGVGNAEQRDATCDCLDETAGFGDSLVKLTADLTVADAYHPKDVVGAPDADLGGAPVLFQPPGCPPLAAANNKNGDLQIWRRDNLAAGPMQTVPLSDGLDAFVGEPSWSAARATLVDAGATFIRAGKRLGAGLLAFRVGAGCRVQPAWSAVTGDGSQPPPLIVGDAVVAAGGSTGGYEAHALRTGGLLWRFATHGSATLGPVIAVAGTVVAGDADVTIYAFRPAP